MKGVTKRLDIFVHPRNVSIHTPNEGSDYGVLIMDWIDSKFQSTLPMKGVTTKRVVREPGIKFQSTLPMKGVTSWLANKLRYRWFQSTLPMKGVTLFDTERWIDEIVSIHTPNEGSDTQRG